MKLSVVITVFNEEENIEPLLKQLYDSLSGIEYEIIVVDDGSTDKTIEQLLKHANTQVNIIELQKNYGQTAAMAAGIDQAKGKYIVTMDGDLQNDPKDIPIMLQRMEKENYDVIAGRRLNRRDNVIRKIPSKIANAIIRWSSGVHIHDYGCSLKIFKKNIAKNLGLYGELHRFIPILAELQGAKILEMDVNHHPRIYGKSKYGLGRTLKVASDLLLMTFFQKYFRRPMHLFGGVGIITFLLGLVINIYLLIEKIIGHDIWGRPLLILGMVLLLGGVQLITIGFVAEIVVRTYFESQDKKTYVIKEIYIGKTTKQEAST